MLAMPPALAACLIASLAGAAAGSSHTISLSRVQHFGEDDVAAESLSSSTEHEFARMHLKHRDGAFYVGKVMLGEEGQEVALMFDTGSSDIVVKSTAALGSLLPDNNESLKSTKRLNYADGAYVEGPLVEGKVCLKDGMYLCLNPTILLGEKYKGHEMEDVLGIFGLGWPAHFGSNFIDLLQERFARPAIGLSLQPYGGSTVSFGDLPDLLIAAKADTGGWPTVMSGWGFWWLKAMSAQGYAYEQGYWSADISLSAGESNDALWQPGFLLFQVILALFLLANLGPRWESASTRPECLAFAWTLAWRTAAFLTIINLVVYFSYNNGGNLWGTMLLDSGTSGLVMLPSYQAQAFADAWIGEHMTHCNWKGGDTSSLICDCSVAEKLKPITGTVRGAAIEFMPKDLFRPYGDRCLTGIDSTFLTVSPVVGDQFLHAVHVVRDVRNDAVYVFPRAANAASRTLADIGNAISTTLTLAVSAWSTVILAIVLASVLEWDYLPQQDPETDGGYVVLDGSEKEKAVAE